MEAHNAAYLNCGILHGNITDRAIMIRDTAGGVAGVLTGFDNATYVSEKAGTANRELPEHMLFRSILSLECAEAPRTRLDDWESLLYVICWLGTYGMNQAERDTIAESPPSYLSIDQWSSRNAKTAASEKRRCMDNTDSFYGDIVGKMRRDPLRSFAIKLYKALFLHEGCSGAYRRYDRHFKVCGPDPLVLRNEFEDQIVTKLLLVVAKHRRAVLLTASKENLSEEI
ncbi:hypothetical protein GGF42_002354 [Coemansia sp. RSA 2424]|nr:hypothetical protein GGF42_002354 [Coemansia sp. RSA 2424]